MSFISLYLSNLVTTELQFSSVVTPAIILAYFFMLREMRASLFGIKKNGATVVLLDIYCTQ